MKKQLIIFIFLFLAIELSYAQSKTEMKSILIETLAKARNAVSTATNEWRYDNTNDDYFKKDTIQLNTARSYKIDFCKSINWSFYEPEKFVLENAQYCEEPPTKLISKNSDFMTLEIKEHKNYLYLNLYNTDGIFESFEVVELKKNKPIYNDENQFDYTIKLYRHKR